MLVKESLVDIHIWFAETMVVIYFAFPALRMVYHVNVAQNLHNKKKQLTDADIYVVPVCHCLIVHVFKQ